MKFLADGACPSVESLTELLGAYGFYANLLALVISLIGTSFFIRRFGLDIFIGFISGSCWFFSFICLD